ncbi:MAG: hypothetical protein ACLRU4_03435 [Peptoniphilus sp.]|uniref:hypothetical protein n=1 Tax=Peptoniphilus sp. TaxID=1971214 RepID=UPI0039A14CA1
MAKEILDYKKEDIIASKTLGYNKDVLQVVLDEGKRYSLEDVEKAYKEYMEREVK